MKSNNSRKIKVMHLRASQGLFGAERVIFGLMKSADSAHFDVELTLIASKDGLNRDFADEIRRCGLRITDFKLRGRLDWAGIRKLRRTVREEGFDVVHCHDFKSNFYGLMSTLGTGTKRITSVHGSTRDSFLLRLYLAFDEYLIIRLFHRIIIVSSHLRDELRRRLIMPIRLTLIPNGLDQSFLEDMQKDEGRERDLFLPSGTIVAGIVGRLLPDKGHEHLFKALTLLKDDFPKLIILVVGDGPQAETLRFYRDQLNLQDRIIFAGIRRNMKRIYTSLDIFVMPSFREGLPMALLEAMLARVPVIATGVGSIPAVLGEGKRGKLVEVGDPEGLARGIRDLLLNPHEAQRIADDAATFVAIHYSLEVMARRTETLYREVLQKRMEPSKGGN